MHNRDFFYKYYSINGALATLENTTRKWTTPKEFNDPFDNQFILNVEYKLEDVELYFKKEMESFLRGSKKIDSFEMLFIKNAFDKMDAKSQDEMISRIYDSKDYTEDFLDDKIDKFNTWFLKFMSDTAIFCMTETNDNLLMWSHYAEQHTGVVIKLLNVKEVDSPLSVARKVIYSKDRLSIDLEEIFDEKKHRNLAEEYPLIKSIDWAYEKEWRIVTTTRSREAKTEILPFSPLEVGAVYLGCNISDENKEKIINVVRTKYPWAEIFQTIKCKNKFALDFEKLHL